jgi:hypothetical protein
MMSFMPKPQQIPARRPLTPEEIEAAPYIGSGEHKVERWWGGLPQAWQGPSPQKATDEHLSEGKQKRARGGNWLGPRGACRRPDDILEGDKTYPKHIWYGMNAAKFGSVLR